ncbi:phosphoglucomutase/phosphomannomutase PgmG [Allosphingosinicella deserti]|uniref:Phosphomannomutase n=1 Tax=Allosphingosinicella deserti TaxID=2116704 RepID=A0A2P7QWE2_9SPHN|nr:phosphomannomutase/phosphoglucomutase [Sphingomonas deserti]PSJ42285.1 phosphomannomutase [Sphingomonas deserti]
MTRILNPTALREYDIRGIYGETLHEADAYAVGRSFGTVVRRGGGTRVAVGRDARLSSPGLEANLVRGLTDSGIDVVRIGVGPSPMLYFAEATLGVDAGIMVTGSHNPSTYNGFKMVLGHGAFFGERIQALGRMSAAADWDEGAGTVTEQDVSDAYLERLLQDFEGRGFRIGWDAGNGAAGAIIERLVKRLPGEHFTLYTELDGRFPNHHPDPTVEKNLADLKALVAEKGLDFGVAFDGDADRIGAVDGEGRVVWGDQLLSILAEPVLAALPGATIIGDVKASQILFDRIAALGGTPLMWKTGHSLIKSKMKETGAPLAGEMSGHIFFGHRWYGFDDALYAAIRLIEAVSQLGGSLTALRSAMPALVNTPELRFQVDESRKFAVVEEVLARLEADGVTIDRTDGARVRTDDGWWLLRASNTQDVLVARAEAQDQAGLDRLLAEIDRQLALSGLERGPEADH